MSLTDSIPVAPARTENSLSKAERGLQALAYLAVGIGIALLLGFTLMLLGEGYLANGPLSLDNSGLVGDFIGGVAGSLFALAGVLLFYVALTLQRKEFHNSITELQKTSESLKFTEQHHRETLGLMREEKEFGVCHVAATGLIQAYKDLSYTDHNSQPIAYDIHYSGKEALDRITTLWGENIVALLAGLATLTRSSTDAHTFDRVFIRYQEILLLNRRLYRLWDALDEKALGTWEREYLLMLITPFLTDMHGAVDRNVHLCLEVLVKLEEEYSPALSTFGLTKKDMRNWRKELEGLQRLMTPTKQAGSQ